MIVERLVYPVPDSTAADEVCAVNCLPIISKSATSIPHRVSVFRDMEGVLNIILALGRTFYPSDGRILVGAHIYDIVVALILHGAGSIDALGRFVAFGEVDTRTSLVAQRPDDDAWMVDVGVNHLQHAGDVLCFELGDMRERSLAVVIFVRLYIGFVLEVDTILVAERVPIGIGRGM